MSEQAGFSWYRKRTLGSLLDAAVAQHGEREALAFGGRRFTYRDLGAETDRLAKALIGLGIEPGDRVALWMTNRPEWVFLLFAVAKVGACLVPLNTRYRRDDVAYAIRQSGSRLLISLDSSGPVDYVGMLAEAMPGLDRASRSSLRLDSHPELQWVVCLGRRGLAGTLPWETFVGAGRRVADEQLRARAEQVDPDGLMIILYTSGTTGSPKGVMHSHRLLRNVAERVAIYGMSFEDVHVNYLPLFHVYGYTEVTIASVMCGARQVLMDVFEADRALDLASEEGATMLHGFEAHWLDLLEAQRKRPRSLPRLALGTLPSGVASTVPVADRVQDVFCPTLSGYGLSEAGAFVACSNLRHSREQRVHASGRAMTDYEFRIIDPETGRDQPVDVSGEILIRGYALMNGYWNKPVETAEAIDAEGWLHTGDMGRLRLDGHLVFEGRYKDMLKVGGENVSPAEVESYLRAMDEIFDVAVVAYPDQRLNEVPVAFVIPSERGPLVESELIARCKGRIASFKIPRHVIPIDALPMTPSGKVRKVELRQRALAILGAPRPDLAPPE